MNRDVLGLDYFKTQLETLQMSEFLTAICSISDSLVTGEELSAEERQTTFTTMMKIALENLQTSLLFIRKLK